LIETEKLGEASPRRTKFEKEIEKIKTTKNKNRKVQRTETK
jgi:hypothetical protein